VYSGEQGIAEALVLRKAVLMNIDMSQEDGEPLILRGDASTEHWPAADTTPVVFSALLPRSEDAITEVWETPPAEKAPIHQPAPSTPSTIITRKITYKEDEDPRRVYLFLGILMAIPLAGIVGLPLLLALLFVFLKNPGGLGEQLETCELLRRVPGFRSGNRLNMAGVSALYLIPMSMAGMVVIAVDVLIMSRIL
jgi:hypothetical protein